MPNLPQPMAIYALTKTGARTARKLKSNYAEAELFLPIRLADEMNHEGGFEKLENAVRDNFKKYPAHVFFAAAGIVVRTIAPLIEHKTVDPAVVVLDPEGKFAVSLLSGHIGGANQLALQTAAVLGGQAVITTATDSAARPSMDLLATEAGLILEQIEALPGINTAVLENPPVPVYDPGGWLDPQISDWPELFFYTDAPFKKYTDKALIWVGNRGGKFPDKWLVLRPKNLAVGMGCNRHTPIDEIESLLIESFEKNNLSVNSIFCLATVSAKQDELGLLDLAEKLGVEIKFFEPEQLEKIPVPNPSETVKKHIGAKSICEAAAICAARNGRLIIQKLKSPNATLAVASIYCK